MKKIVEWMDKTSPILLKILVVLLILTGALWLLAEALGK